MPGGFARGQLSFKGEKKAKKKKKKSKHTLEDAADTKKKSSSGKKKTTLSSDDEDKEMDNKKRQQYDRDHESDNANDSDDDDLYDEDMTEAEKNALRKKRERQRHENLSIAQKSHRERVEEFNENLSKLTELNDIPRVSYFVFACYQHYVLLPAAIILVFVGVVVFVFWIFVGNFGTSEYYIIFDQT